MLLVQTGATIRRACGHSIGSFPATRNILLSLIEIERFRSSVCQITQFTLSAPVNIEDIAEQRPNNSASL